MKINTVYRLNKKIQEGKIKELILFSEAIHEKKIAEIAHKIKERNNVIPSIINISSFSNFKRFPKYCL